MGEDRESRNDSIVGTSWGSITRLLHEMKETLSLGEIIHPSPIRRPGTLMHLAQKHQCRSTSVGIPGQKELCGWLSPSGENRTKQNLET